MCVTLEKREIVSEVGESLFIFKDRFNTPQDRKSKKKKCFSSGAFSVWLMFLFFCLLESNFLFSDVFIYFLKSPCG